MAVPDYLEDQEEEYIKARGYTFRDFSAEQVMDMLKLQEISKKCEEKYPAMNAFIDEMYKKQGYKQIKSNSIVGGYMWKKG